MIEYILITSTHSITTFYCKKILNTEIWEFATKSGYVPIYKAKLL